MTKEQAKEFVERMKALSENKKAVRGEEVHTAMMKMHVGEALTHYECRVIYEYVRKLETELGLF